MKANHYRNAASIESDASRREAFELLADTFDRLAAEYERIEVALDAMLPVYAPDETSGFPLIEFGAHRHHFGRHAVRRRHG